MIERRSLAVLSGLVGWGFGCSIRGLNINIIKKERLIDF